jgi:GAF domain-containing protein
MPEQAVLARTFVELADNLVEDFDVIDVLTLLTDRSVEVLDVTAAGLMLASPAGKLRVMASSNDAVRMLELYELQAEEGPCFDCFGSGEPILNYPLNEPDDRWPRFVTKARAAGFDSVHALPMRLRGATIGSLNLFRAGEGVLGEDDVVAGQAFADVATIAILQHRAAAEAQALNNQLSHALTSRIVIEQAKGVIAESLGVDMDEAFLRLRGHARSHNLRLADLAARIRDHEIKASALDRRP